MKRRSQGHARGRERGRAVVAARSLEPVVDYTRLLACLKRAGEPLSLPDILRRLELDSSVEPALRRQMEFLEKQGVVFSHRRGRWTMHSRARVVIGRLSSPKRTYGFVAPEQPGSPDVYIAGRRMNGAGHGDLVMARVLGSRARSDRGNDSVEGEVVAVLERRPPFVAGLFHGDGSGGVVIPRDDRIAAEILIDDPPPEVESAGPSRDGLVVWAEITVPEDRFKPAKGKIIAVLGRPDEPGVDASVVERTYQLPGEFPAAATKEAAAFGTVVADAALAGREDFTATIVVTVDPATARDHDDAVSLERVATSHGEVSRLTVHIADVSHYVREGNAIDEEAVRRGTSVYFPGYSIPMLPEALSSGLCSLHPGELRLVQTVVMDFDDTGKRLGYRFADGVIRSNASLTYDQLADILKGKAAPVDERTVAMLMKMETLCRALRARRMSRGSLDLNLPETEVIVDDDGRPVELRVVEHNIAHEVIEEFMLAANETVAEHLSGRMSPSLYRIHEDPDPTGIDEVEEGLLLLGFPVRRTRGTSSSRIRSLLGAFKGRPEEPAIAMMILRSLKLARYSHEAIGHFGLAAPLYTHFTSPIRRYPDLVVHRILRETRKPGWRPPEGGPDPGDRLAAVALESSRLERRAEEAERAMVEWKKAVYMKDRVGHEFQGMVTGMTANAVFVTLDGLGVEGIVPTAPRDTTGDRDRRTGDTRRRAVAAGKKPAAGRWRPGDRLRVRVQAIDTFRARILLKPLSTG